MSLTIINGPPRYIGIRAKDYPYSSSLLEGKQSAKDKPRALTLEDINADPKSSDDESSTRQEKADVGQSDGSLTGVAKKKKKGTNQLELKGKSEGCPSPKGHNAEAAAASLQNPPSHIASTIFTSKQPVETHTGSQSNQKRLRDETDDDMSSFGSMNHSQSRKARLKTYGGSSNIHKASAGEQKRAIKAAPAKMKKKEGPPFRHPNTELPLARLARMEAESKGSKRATWKEIPSVQASPRAQRASQRSAYSTQESSQNSSKDFKQPLRLSPNKGSKFRAIPVTCEEVAAPQATRASAPATKPLLVTDVNAFKSSELKNAIKTVTDKLGISDMQMKPSPWALGDSSAPPTSLDAATTTSSPLSSLDDFAFDSDQEGIPIIRSEDIPFYNPGLQPSTCPMCQQPVDKAYLEQFTKIGTRMSLRQQAQFCKAHKERSAESEWTERGYPNIDWQQLDARIANFHTSMDDVLSRRKFSFYRNAYEDSLKSGKNKTIQKSLMGGDEIEGTSPGYYGGRGAKVMAENIMSRFAPKLRRLAASDMLIFSGGVSRYVQAVLVPELAVLLVTDDMRVDEEKAREVLRDSVDIGNLLNEEEDEIITDPAPEEREVVDMTKKGARI